jgi:hypothetical protein
MKSVGCTAWTRLYWTFCPGDIGVNIGGRVCPYAETARQSAIQSNAVLVAAGTTIRGGRVLSRVRHVVFANPRGLLSTHQRAQQILSATRRGQARRVG